MFCRVCGEKNDEGSLYCSRDGEILQKEVKSFKVVNSDVGFCKECGESALKNDLYCSNCGLSLYNIKDTKKNNIEEIIKETSYSSGFDIKSLLKYSLASFGIILLISILISRFINETFVQALIKEIGFNIDKKLISFLDVITILNISSLKMELMTLGRSMLTFSFDGMFFVSALVPITVFLVMGVYISSVHRKDKKQFELKEYIFIALSYGIMIAILSVLASRKVQFNVPYSLGSSEFDSMEFIKKYSFLNTFIKASLISFFSLSLGSGIYNFFKDLKKRQFTPLSIATIIFMVSAIYTFFIVTFIGKAEAVYGGQYEAMWQKATIFAQIFIYIFLIINMGTFKLMNNEEMVKSSLLNNMDGFKEGIIGVQYLYIGLFINMFLFFCYGRNFKRKNKDIKEIFYLPAIYSLGLAILAYLTSINMSMNILDLISIEFSFINILIGSFLISILSTFAGYFLTSNVKGKVETNE